MVEQIDLFPEASTIIHETWICQRAVMLGARCKVAAGEKVIIINRYKDTQFDLDMIVLLYNSTRVESIQSFFEKHFYILTRGTK